MTSSALFLYLMITALLLIRAWREWKRDRRSAAVMVAIPVIGWLGIGAALLPQAPQFEMYDQWDAGWFPSHSPPPPGARPNDIRKR